jgi:hypothetical protein
MAGIGQSRGDRSIFDQILRLVMSRVYAQSLSASMMSQEVTSSHRSYNFENDDDQTVTHILEGNQHFSQLLFLAMVCSIIGRRQP